jgi:hypothetical protein
MPMLAAILGALTRARVSQSVIDRVEKELRGKVLARAETCLVAGESFVLFANAEYRPEPGYCLDTRYMIIV